MNKRRLLKLADLLEEDAKNKKGLKFDYGWWGEVNDAAKPVSCGTTACAFGLAAISGAFKRSGLNFSIRHGGSIIFFLNGKAKKPITAAMSVFDISKKQAEYLFVDALDDYNSIVGSKAEHKVAEVIRDFVKSDGTIPRTIPWIF